MFYISDSKEDIQLAEVKRLLAQSYWAQKRTMDVIQRSIEGSLCFGAYLEQNGKQVGFARVITDYATNYYLCDVIVDEPYRGMGVGKALVRRIVDDERLQGLRGVLATHDAHGLYEQYGFRWEREHFMGKEP